MSDKLSRIGIGFPFVFFYKFFGSRKSNLVDVFVHLLGSHSNAIVFDGKRFGFFVNHNFNGKIAQFFFNITHRSEGF